VSPHLLSNAQHRDPPLPPYRSGLTPPGVELPLVASPGATEAASLPSNPNPNQRATPEQASFAQPGRAAIGFKCALDEAMRMARKEQAARPANAHLKPAPKCRNARKWREIYFWNRFEFLK